MRTVVDLINLSPSHALDGDVLEKVWMKKLVYYDHLKVFGCIVYVHVPDELRTKLDPKAEKCVFIGYSLEQKGYKCYNPVTCQV